MLGLRATLDGLATDAKDNLNLELCMPKCALLLPRGHPLLLEDLACFEGVKGSSEFLRGMRIAGLSSTSGAAPVILQCIFGGCSDGGVYPVYHHGAKTRHNAGINWGSGGPMRLWIMSQPLR